MPSIISIFYRCAAENKDIALKLGTHVVPKQLHSYRQECGVVVALFRLRLRLRLRAPDRLRLRLRLRLRVQYEILTK